MMDDGESCVAVDNGYYYHYSLVFDRQSFGQSKDYFASRKMQVSFSMSIGNVELMHECFHEHDTWEQQELNNKKQRKKVKWEE